MPAARVILVEGMSDRAALEALARRRGLQPPEIVVLGGAYAVRKFVEQSAADAALVGLCDANEERVFRRVLATVYVCSPDLEGELLRALGCDRVLEIIDAVGELDSFRTLQRQPAHRASSTEVQLRRFLAGRSGNKERYAQRFVDALELHRVPSPLDAALGWP